MRQKLQQTPHGVQHKNGPSHLVSIQAQGPGMTCQNEARKRHEERSLPALAKGKQAMADRLKAQRQARVQTLGREKVFRSNLAW